MHAELAAKLKDVLADSAVLWFRAQSAHWNVTGPQFHAYHELFGEVYEDAWGSLDTTAEAMRQIGVFAPVSLCGLVEGEPEFSETGDSETLVREVLDANAAVTKCLYEAFAVCNQPECNAQGIANYVAGRIEAHEKWTWQLAATLGESADKVVPTDSDDETEPPPPSNPPPKKRGAYPPGVSK